MAQSLWCSRSASACSSHLKYCINRYVSATFSNVRPCFRHKIRYWTDCPHLTNHWTRNQLSQPDDSYALNLSTIVAHANATRAQITEATKSTALDPTLAARESAEAESLQILEWPAICKQVACFCGTSVAADFLARGHLPRGRSREESELLLQQTSEALAANLMVRGCFDIRPAVEAAAAGVCLNGKQLEGVASTLEAAFDVRAQARVRTVDPIMDSATGTGGAAAGSARTEPAAAFRYPALAALSGGFGEEERTLLRAIRECIRHGSVTDAASEALAAVRAARQSNKETLRGQVDTWARSLQAKGASEPGSVSLVRGRLCVGVKAGRQSELPRGSVRLGTSSTGATLYMEPTPLVPLNNQEALFAEQEEREVTRVLGLLSQMLAGRSSAVMLLLSAVTDLDVVAARARHSVWLGASSRAEFVEPSPGMSPLHLPGLLHPVIMQRGLPSPPQPPSVDDNRFDRDFAAAPAWELRRVVRPDGPQPVGPGVGEAEAAGGGSGGGLPRPLDLRVPSGKAVVAITGPNTGGKTVTLKAAGLAVLMAQAGLYLPCSPEATATHGPPRLAWFDTVLADIGDAQSLQQSLSTFSGHVRRIQQVLSAAGPASLVLLDEVGSGTDPLEGAALARAVLDRLAGQARLTLATTHHAELKRAAEEDERFGNVSMAFDVASLRPTYRLVWGAAGASNALDIAETLGFDRSVVTEARQIARALADNCISSPPTSSFPPTSSSSPLTSWVSSGASSRLAGVAASLVAQLDETAREVEEVVALRERRSATQARVREAISAVQQMEEQLRQSPQQIVQERDSLASEVQEALDAFAAGLAPQAGVEEALRRIEALIPDQVASHRGQQRRTPGVGSAGSSAAGEQEDDEEEWDNGQVLRPGDAVYVKSYGDVGHATVVTLKGDYVTVKFDAGRLLLGGGASGRAGRSVKLHKRQVQRVLGGQSAPFGVVGWSQSYTELATDIRRVLGEAAGQQRDRQGAAAAAQRTSRQASTRISSSTTATTTTSYGALYDTLAHEVDAVTDDMLLYDYGNPDANYVVEALHDDDENGSTD